MKFLKWLGILVVVLFVSVVVLASYEMPAHSACGYELRAKVDAEKAVLSHLKSPKTAEFEHVVAQKDVGSLCSAWVVHGQVTSQNGFGALLTSSFRVDMNWNEADQGYIVMDVVIDD